ASAAGRSSSLAAGPASWRPPGGGLGGQRRRPRPRPASVALPICWSPWRGAVAVRPGGCWPGAGQRWDAGSTGEVRRVGGDDVAVAELLAALSVATDLGMGQEPEMAVRACLVATRLAGAAGLAGRDVADVYYCTLLQHLGCTAASHETAVVFGDDLASAPRAE